MLTLCACNVTKQSNNPIEKTDYDKWLESDDAVDVNGDNKIDETDYQIQLALNAWLDSDDATDYNNDRRINYDDYVISEAYKEWKKSDASQDLNGDKKISFEDYEAYRAYLAWKSGEESIDLNDDKKIDIEDYLAFIGKEYQSYTTWKKSEDAFDYNEDEIIDKSDYEIKLAYDAWLDSDDANDMNRDRVINYNDYVIFLNPSMNDYDRWLISENVRDFNNDKTIDSKDYQIFSLMGTYEFIEFRCVSTGLHVLYLDHADFSTRDFEKNLSEFNIVFSLDGMELNISDDMREELGEEDTAYLVQLIKQVSYVFLTPELIALDITIDISNVTVPVTFYVRYTDNKLTASFNISYDDNGQETYMIEFSLRKVTNE